MPTKSFTLTNGQANFIHQNVVKGKYRSASEVVSAGLRLLERQAKEDKLKLKALRRLAMESFDAIDRGEFESVDAGGIDSFLARLDPKSRY
jgi:antitoxin ParD1/3/4